MKLHFWLAACLALTVHAHGEESEKERIRQIGKRYEQIEGQLARSVHYMRTGEKEGATVTKQAWLTEARDILKVSTEFKGLAGRELVEIFIGAREDPFLVLQRHEQPLANGATQVDEKRWFFTQFALTRLLTKKAIFPPGDPLDTVKVKNAPVDISRLPEHDREGLTFSQQASELVTSLVHAGPPEHDPGAGSPGDSARYRLIQRTTSPEGRLALGFGGKEEPVQWKDLEDTVDEVTGYQQYSSNDESLRNYVVDLSTHRILGATGCSFIGTRDHYNHRENFVTWSPNDRFFVQTFDSKWATDEARAGWIDLAHQKIGTSDLLAPATAHAYKFLAARKDPAYRQFGERFAVRVSCSDLLDDGAMRLEVTGEIPKSEEKNSTFSVIERFRIQPAGGRVTLQFLDARMGE